jgi:hypothetical protein
MEYLLLSSTVIVGVIIYLRSPVMFVKLFGVFILLQEWIVRLLYGYETPSLVFLKILDDYLTFTLFILLIVRWLIRLKIEVKFARILIYVPVFLFSGILPHLKDLTRVLPGIYQAFLYLKPFFFFFIVASLNFSEADIIRIVKFFGVIALIVLFGALLNIIFPQMFVEARLIAEDEIVSIRAHNIPQVVSFLAGSYSWFMMFIFIFLLCYYIVTGTKKYFWLALTFLFGGFLQLKRIYILGFIGVILNLLLILRPNKFLNMIFKLTFILLITAFFWIQYVNKLYELFLVEYIQPDPKSVSRIAIYETAFKIAADNFPLGAGFGQFGSWMSRIYYSPLYEKYGLSSIYGLSKEAPYHITDTFYPMLIAELGFLGCFIYLVFIFNISYPIFIKLKSGGLPPLKRVFCLAGIVIMIEGLI